MAYLTITLIALALSMDAFAVSLCFGSCTGYSKKALGIRTGLFFGIFQALMPLIGWAAGLVLEKQIREIDHWIAFVLLAFVGGKMILNAIKNKSCPSNLNPKSFWVMISLSIATSIDALVIGLSLAILQIPILLSVAIIGSITFILSFTGVWLGNKMFGKLGNKAEITGGIILVLLGLKILIEHIYLN